MDALFVKVVSDNGWQVRSLRRAVLDGPSARPIMPGQVQTFRISVFAGRHKQSGGRSGGECVGDC